jgi:hypothetical protein
LLPVKTIGSVGVVGGYSHRDPQATLVNKAENTTAKIPPSRNIEKTEPPDASGGQPDDANKSSGSGPVPDPPTSRILTAEEAARRFLNGGIQND